MGGGLDVERTGTRGQVAIGKSGLRSPGRPGPHYCDTLGDMCGRFANVASAADLTDEFDVGETIGDELPPSWNIAPTDPVRVIMQRRPRDSGSDTAPMIQLRTVQWGLVPNWSRTRTGPAKMINTRSESLATKPTFKTTAARRRCLVPALGYYEWQRTDQGKVAHFLHHPDSSQLLAFAGLYELWRDPDLPDDNPNKWLWTCSIITQPAADVLGHIHDRCPVIVPAHLRHAWLDCSSEDPATAQQLLEQIPEAHLQPDVVSPDVGNVRNNRPDLIAPIDPAQHPDQERLQL
jgi:putative SOS response-associated peptidase YedK